MPPDLIVYALVTAGLIFWLRSILGTRNGDEGERPAPYLKPDPAARALEGPGAARSGETGPLDRISELAANPKGNAFIADKTVELGLLEIASADQSFDIDRFIQGSQDAFVFIVESFADGDRDTLRDLLAPAVYDAFDGAITARTQAGETLHTEINAIKRVEITAAGLEGRVAKITVRFIAEEVTYTRNAKGDITEGHPERVTQMRDLWTFSRETRSRDPRWLVTETLVDVQQDSDTVPNSSSVIH